MEIYDMKQNPSPNKLWKLAQQNRYPFVATLVNAVILAYERDENELKSKKAMTALRRTSIKNLVPIQSEINHQCLRTAIGQNYESEDDRVLVSAVEKYVRKKEECCLEKNENTKSTFNKLKER